MLGTATTHWMYWMYPALNTIGLTNQKSLQKEKNHINGIENFWNQAKRHLRKYNGIDRILSYFEGMRMAV